MFEAKVGNPDHPLYFQRNELKPGVIYQHKDSSNLLYLKGYDGIVYFCLDDNYPESFYATSAQKGFYVAPKGTKIVFENE